ncbi:MAG: excinuclease ABC subunit UvrC [Oceanococcaceae bacterium]
MSSAPPDSGIPPRGDFDPEPFLRDLTTRPGVYCMFGADDQVLYVGKARNLKNRVSSYFSSAAKPARIMQMVSRITRIEVTVTPSEDQALILEHALIKERRPRYNILFRDDKSYPWMRVSGGEAPRISMHRGQQRPGHQYFGPYASAAAVKDTIATLQRTFQLRTCRDSDYANRSRPCLMFQIKRCSAPCTREITLADYQADVNAAMAVLSGQGEHVVEQMHERMQTAAVAQRFEQAAELRDRIGALRRLQESRVVTAAGGSDFDLVCVARHHGVLGVALMPVRGGRSLGTRSHFPQGATEAEPADVLRSFVQQHYLDRRPPAEIVLSDVVDDAEALSGALSLTAGFPVTVHARSLRGPRKRLQVMTAQSLHAALIARLSERETLEGRYQALMERLDLPAPITRMECFDISHTQGEGARASCVVFGDKGPDKSQYRRFAIAGITPGDDYAAIEQAVLRRYTRISQGEIPAPDVLFIDGGRGQLNAALAALRAVDFEDGVRVISISKGPERRAGEEELHLPERANPLILASDDPALHLIQQIRDESHRFALLGHRQQRARTRTRSVLEDIPGLGAKRRGALLRQFGGMAQVRRASAEDLARVPGISRTLAQRLYDHLHDTE